jgi:hypothetical protein
MYGGEETVYGSDKDLAIVVGDGFTEKVSFIELKNIRAILIRRFPLLTRAALMAIPFWLFFIFIAFSNQDFPVWGLILVFALHAFLYGIILLGLKTCSVRIVTDVNEHTLVNVHRLRIARKLLHFVTERMQPYLSPDVSAEAPVAAAVPPPPPPVITPEPEPEAL